MTTYKIGEAAALLNLKTYVLRFWETEFPDIVPLRTEKGQRLYTTEHLALLERIRFLLHDRGLTIGGARKVLAEEKERGVVYTFHRSGIPPDASVGAVGLGGYVAAGVPAEGRIIVPLLAGDDEREHEAVPEDAEDDDGPGESDTVCRDESFSDGLPSQCRLPGLEQIMAMRASVLDSGDGERYSRLEDEPPAQVSSTKTQGMLPLFAVAKAAYLAGQASGNRTGGGNFIHAGTSSASGAEGGTTLLTTFGEAPDRSAVLLRNMLGIIYDLESVASLLRYGVSKPTTADEE